MKTGELRHRVTIQKSQGGTLNSLGEETTKYVDYKTVWAAVEPLKGREREYQNTDQFQAEVDYRIRIRYTPDLKPNMRIVFRGRIFSIQAIINIDERNREIHFHCLERVES